MDATSKRLTRTTVASQVRDFIVMEIAQGRLPLGAPVREMEIAAQLGTSQTPVREAFRELAALGLLESRIHVGTRVRQLAEKDLVEAVPIRSALEGIAGRLAASNYHNHAEEVRGGFEAMKEAAEGGDRRVFAAASTTFHRSVVRAAENASLLRAWNALGIEVMTILAMASSDVPLDDAAESHRPIVDALEAGDPELAEHALTHHVAAYLPATAHSNGEVDAAVQAS
ncbi:MULTISPECIES: GntR family transcriptional regulator [Micrococcaceae]|uniref:Transcriptional regulator n=1 Tax=Pseudarthrobacter phenanthrenivorans (strain DSM 18606 / JCM 16027 / LMG 23796 / Sphe3) TaxID=930171 RepID=F0M5I7_PSEPM|nr:MULTISPECIES: GntR family transcriptional regulator [Micrococcaceae]ADX71319.1 transcriptional regulator [Pseudarthrobacter phenanthrenivorans Sphe3]MDV2982412.1 GntR family transcriptional regulator [Actinomycetes bacterium ARC8]GKV71904.1 GntR family transcriptional regulator [Pseudarthrobacter sp. NCCP-2145]